ncbi:ATP-binding protein [Streptomyces sp. CC228A]|uniref:ATP-binding protein n=1 Tax=Streptomyces sp. CC228A TaxID=2898186 RepID=UPI0035A8E21D
MDPMNRRPDEHGHRTTDDADDTGADTSRARASRDDLPPLAAGGSPAPARTAQLVSGDFLLTVNPVDGSEIEPCPPGRQPGTPGRRTAEQRAERDRAAAPPVPAGPAAPDLPLLERDEQHDRLVRLLTRGRSVRLTGPHGAGRSRLLDAVAADCAGLAPDGVIRLSGHRRTPTELLYELFAAVHHAPDHRPDRAGLLALVRDVGAVVLVDDLEFGGAALDELLDAAPECAFLLAATPATPAPSSGADIEEVFLTGLDRTATLELLEDAVGRELTDEEANWAGDLWFESEGLPLRFVQAAALLRQRDAQREALSSAPDGEDTEDEDGESGEDTDASVFADDRVTPLPGLGEAAAPAALLASRLSEAARETLRFAVALGGEVPHQAHLPALVGDTHADAAVGELLACGLLTPVGPRYRLAAGIAEQLTERGYADGALARAHTAAQHYAWWAGHPRSPPNGSPPRPTPCWPRSPRSPPARRQGTPARPYCSPAARPPPSPPGSTGAPGSARCAAGRAPPGPRARSRRRRTSTTSSASSRCAPATSTGPAPNWRRPSACAARSPTSAARSPAAGRWRSSPTANGAARRRPAPRGGLPRLRTRPARRRPGPAEGRRHPHRRRRARGPPRAHPRRRHPGRGPGRRSRRRRRRRTGGHRPRAHAAVRHPRRRHRARLRAAPGRAAAAPGGPLARLRGSLLTGARRNLVAAGAGALLAAVLGTVVTLGATSGDGGDTGGAGDRTVTTDHSTGGGDGIGGDGSATSGGSGDDAPGADGTTGGSGGTGGATPGAGTTGGTGAGDGTPGTPVRPGATGSAGDGPSSSGSESPSGGESGTTPSGGGSSTTGGSSSPSPSGSSSSSTGSPTSGTTGSGGTDTTTGGTTDGTTTTGGTGDSGGTTTGSTDSGGTDTTGGTTTGSTDSGGTDTTGGTTTDGTTTGGDGDTDGSTGGEEPTASGLTTSGGGATGDTGTTGTPA